MRRCSDRLLNSLLPRIDRFSHGGKDRCYARGYAKFAIGWLLDWRYTNENSLGSFKLFKNLKLVEARVKARFIWAC